VATLTLVAVCNREESFFNTFNLRTTTCTANECGASAGSDELVHARFVRTGTSFAANQLLKTWLETVQTHLDNFLMNDREPGRTDTHSLYWDGAWAALRPWN
jgi:hypothetical protein